MDSVIQSVSYSLAADKKAFQSQFCNADHYETTRNSAYCAPFFEVGLANACEFWVALAQENIPVGRCAAFVSEMHSGYGYVGLFDVDISHPEHQATARALLESAFHWLQERGVRKAFGPIDGNTWYPHRFKLDWTSPQTPSFEWEPRNPDEYRSLFEMCGFRVSNEFYSSGFEAPTFDPALRILAPSHASAMTHGYSFRPFAESTTGFARDLEVLYELACEGFRNNFLFEPISFSAFRQIHEDVAQRYDYAPSNFLVNPAGVEQGFMFAFIDQDYVVVKSVCVLPQVLRVAKMQRWAASNALLFLALQEGSRRKLRGGVSALVHQTASKRLPADAPSRVSNAWQIRYVLLSRDLD